MWGIWELSVLPLHLFCKSRTVLKFKIYVLKVQYYHYLFSAQIVPALAIRISFRLASQFFCPAPTLFQVLPYFLAPRGGSGSSWTFPASGLRQPFLQGGLALFIGGQC